MEGMVSAMLQCRGDSWCRRKGKGCVGQKVRESREAQGREERVCCGVLGMEKGNGLGPAGSNGGCGCGCGCGDGGGDVVVVVFVVVMVVAIAVVVVVVVVVVVAIADPPWCCQTTGTPGRRMCVGGGGPACWSSCPPRQPLPPQAPGKRSSVSLHAPPSPRRTAHNHPAAHAHATANVEGQEGPVRV